MCCLNAGRTEIDFKFVLILQGVKKPFAALTDIGPQTSPVFLAASVIHKEADDNTESQTAQLVMVTCGDEISMAH